MAHVDLEDLILVTFLLWMLMKFSKISLEVETPFRVSSTMMTTSTPLALEEEE